MITKTHFESIAKILNEYRAIEKHAEICKKFCIYFKNENPLFNEHKFLEACGIKK